MAHSSSSSFVSIQKYVSSFSHRFDAYSLYCNITNIDIFRSVSIQLKFTCVSNITRTQLVACTLCVYWTIERLTIVYYDYGVWSKEIASYAVQSVCCNQVYCTFRCETNNLILISDRFNKFFSSGFIPESKQSKGISKENNTRNGDTQT